VFRNVVVVSEVILTIYLTYNCVQWKKIQDTGRIAVVYVCTKLIVRTFTKFSCVNWSDTHVGK